MNEFIYKRTYKTTYIEIDDYRGENFEIKKSKEEGKFNIYIKINSFDKIDAMKRGKKIFREIISFLSVYTNQAFYISNRIEDGLSETYNVYQIDK